MIFFISYDIADAGRLQKVAGILENYGIRIQYSFFECEMEKEKLDELKRKLLEILDKTEDSLKIYPICADCTRKTTSLGNGDISIPKNYEIL